MDTRYDQVAELLDAALALPRDRREAFLDRECGGDDALRAEVDSLLQAHEDASTGFLEASAPLSLDLGEAFSQGRLLGAYRIDEEIGRGGMGVVYRARRDDDAFQRIVAIKLVRPGLDAELTRRRFDSERRILARLDHPNIARLLDAGTTPQGQAYFVMEHIEGDRLDHYCVEKALPLHERLRLFQTVCDAVHHAHRSLVVHRDLKPSNILVTEDGVPKLLDFGIAKALDPTEADAASQTMTGWPLLTPAYASPEQVRGGPITTATDVYALGMILCEMLTGRLPYEVGGLPTQEIFRVILEREAARPSEIAPHEGRRVLAGDLDQIVAKALRKEPSARYASAAQLSEDIQRYLDGAPVQARRGTFRYRVGKFVRRHYLGVAATAVAALGLVGGIVVATWQAHVADRHRHTAERRFGELRQVANYFLSEFHELIRDLPGSTKARAALVKRMLTYLDRLALEAADDSKLQREVAAGYEKLGDVQGSPYGQSLGDSSGARRSYRKAERIRESLLAKRPRDPALQRELARSRQKMGDILWVAGDYPASLASYRRALALREPLVAKRPGDVPLLQELRLTIDAMGDLLMPLGHTAEALDRYRTSLRLAKQIGSIAPDNRKYQARVATAHLKLGLALIRNGKSGEALALFQRALPIYRKIHGKAPKTTRGRYHLFGAHQSLAKGFFYSGRLPEALAEHRRALEVARRSVSSDEKDAWSRVDLLAQSYNIADVLRESGKAKEAEASYRRALDYAKAEIRADPKSKQNRRSLQLVYYGLGRALALGGKFDDALGAERQALKLVRRTLAESPNQPEANEDLAATLLEVGRAQLGARRFEEAVKALAAAARRAAGLAAKDPGNAEIRVVLAASHTARGRAHAARALDSTATSDTRAAAGKKAVAAFGRATKIWAQLSKGGRLHPIYRRFADQARRELAKLRE